VFRGASTRPATCYAGDSQIAVKAANGARAPKRHHAGSALLYLCSKARIWPNSRSYHLPFSLVIAFWVTCTTEIKVSKPLTDDLAEENAVRCSIYWMPRGVDLLPVDSIWNGYERLSLVLMQVEQISKKQEGRNGCMFLNPHRSLLTLFAHLSQSPWVVPVVESCRNTSARETAPHEPD
jgi:hypothetical protein